MANILVLHGPNLNLLGTREPEHYGSLSLNAINTHLIQQGDELGHQIICFQSNGEQPLIERIHQTVDENIAFIIINPAAFTHTSIALRDALLAVGIPFIEVHLSNIYQREPFRHQSYFSDIALGVITGLGAQSYVYAIEAADQYLLETEH
jgi:3-dehydroquinate dehydratase-2